MSLVVTLFVREGIVLASDSRITLNSQQSQQGINVVQQLAISQSDSVNKTFLAPNNIGISMYGAADIQGVPISGFIESFISEHLGNQSSMIAVDQVPSLLLGYFQNLPESPATIFHIAGYKKENDKLVQHVYTLEINNGNINRVNMGNVYGEQGATWGGESDILTRLISPVFLQNNNNYTPLPNFSIPFQFFTLQDAVDFAVYAIGTTIESMRFMARAKTVGGPIDVLIIKPDKAEWVKRKTLHT